MNDLVHSFWQRFVQSGACPPDVAADDLPPAWEFGDSPAMADELGQLVVAGVKTATCGSLWESEYDGDPMPQVGELDIVLDGQGRPLCVIEFTEVAIKPFSEVDAGFAYDEGEGDRTLASWREEHWDFFSRGLSRIGRTPEESMPLICQRFRVIYKA